MMRLLNYMRADWIKYRRTGVFWIHIVFSVAAASLFFIYLYLYKEIDQTARYRLITEVMMLIIPLFAGTVCGVSLYQEERNSQFQVFLGAGTSKGLIYTSKLITLLSQFIMAAAIVFLLTLAGIRGLGMQDASIRFYFQLIGLCSLVSVPLYIFHMFLAVKIGLGATAFAGIVESMLIIFMTNMPVDNGLKYFPLTWGPQLSRILVGRQFQTSIDYSLDMNQLIIMICCGAGALFTGSLLWFIRWEGRK